MTKAKSYGKKALSILLTLLMCLTLIPLMGDTVPEAEAATAGTYSVKVRIKTNNSVDVGDNKNLTITLNHKGNNGIGSALTAKTASVSYTWAENDNADNTYTFTGCGYPTSVSVACTYAWTLAITRKWEFTMYVSVLDNDTNTYTQVLEQSFSKSGDGAGQTEVTFNSNTIGSTPAATRIEWTNTAKSITVPKTGTATANTESATVYDQYGVEWYQEPYYALNSATSATSTTETISGITRTTTQADKCTVSVTNAARTWVDNGGGASRDVYVTAYLNTAKSSTTKFTVNQVQYNIKFYNGGTLLNTASANQLFNYNKQPYYNGQPTKTADEQYTYVFDGWTKSSDGSGTVYSASNIPVATADTAYYAHYDKIINQYTVTFKNYDGTVLQSGKINYGTTPAYTGTTPVRENTPEYSYTFAGWEPSISSVTGEATYTAYFTATKNKYSVEFQNYDGSTLQSGAVEYGAMPSYTGATPTRQSTDEYDFVFSGWTPEPEAVTTQAVYKATYDSVKRTYPVVFKDEDGTVLQNTKWEYGTMPAYSETPTKDATAEYTYTFKGWSPAVVAVTGAAEYTAVYDAVKNEYTVYYKNYDGSAITDESVEYGEAAQMAASLAPTKPSSDGKTYVFAGWSVELDYITRNTYAVAQYAVEGAENYWVTFVDSDGTVLYKTIVEEGGTAVYGGEEVAKDGYAFVGWDKSLENITEDITVTALYSKEGEQYVVTYVDWDDTFITSMIVNHGEAATAPADPERAGDENTVYTFSGWDKDASAVTENLVIKATYSVHTHEYGTFVENVAPATCADNRTDKFSCSCGLTKDIEIADSKDADNHAGTLTLTGAKAARCLVDGYTGDMVCDVCGEAAAVGEVIKASGHTKGDVTVENAEDGSCTIPGTYDEVYYCTVCHEEISREKKTGALLPHTPGDAVKENVTAPKCEEDGSYDSVVNCSVCGTEISREKIIDPKTGHTEETIPAVDATCTKAGLTEGVKCSVCGEVLTAQEDVPALDHNMGEWTVTAPATCTAKGEERADCSRCDYFETREIDTIAHTEETIPAVDASCTEAGLTEGVKCSVCGEVLTAQEDVPALDHNMGEWVVTTPATCTAKGEERADCSRCDYFETREIDTIAHTEETIPAVDASCTEAGLTEGVKCSVCGEVLTAQEDVPALDHAMGEWTVTAPATCTAKGEERADCSRCDYFETRELAMIAHTKETIPAVDASCTEAGLTEGVKCSVCGEVLTAQEDVPALDHAMGEWVVTTPATCTAKGEERADCSRCDYFETRELAMIAHTKETIPAVDATCTKAGLTEGVKCSVCGEVLTAQEDVPALNHAMGEWTVTTPATCTAKGEERAECSRCDYFETRELDTVAHTWADADCTKPSTCSVCGATSGDVIGHDMGEWVVTTPATCTAKGEERADCSRCDYFETRELAMIAHTKETIPAVDATCTEAGLTEGVKCSVCGEVLTAQEDVSASGHDMGEWTVTAPATCTAKGEERAECSRCDYFETRELAMIAHTKETIPAVDATCTKAGLTEGVKCSVCGEVLTAQEDVPAPGHDMGEWTVTAPATCTAKGEERAECSRCDYFETRELAMIAHTKETIPAVDATCTKAGLTEGVKCSVCGEILTAQENVPAPGHDMGEWTVTAPATCTAKGEERADCSRCDYFETRELAMIAHTEETIPAVDATCTEAGLTEGVKCSVCGEILTAQENVPAPGHDMGEWTVTAPATCTAKGEERADCSECDYFETRELAKLAHTEETVIGKAPTCTEAGLTDGVKCSVCGETLTAQTVITAVGHSWSEWTVVKAATETENGLERRECDNCEVYEERVLYFKDNGIIINALDEYYTGRTLPITAAYDPSGKPVEAPVWTSSNEGIVFISDGRLIAIGEGEVTLTVTDGEFTATATINVVAGGDARRVQFVNMDKMHFIIEDYYRVFDTAGFYWAEGEAIRFKVHTYSNFDFETYIVYVDGKEIEADENGYYTIPADTEWGIVTVQGAGYVEDSDGNTAKLSFWEMLLAFFRKIIAFFKGLAG